jgi:hypothetical protein
MGAGGGAAPLLECEAETTPKRVARPTGGFVRWPTSSPWSDGTTPASSCRPRCAPRSRRCSANSPTGARRWRPRARSIPRRSTRRTITAGARRRTDSGSISPPTPATAGTPPMPSRGCWRRRRSRSSPGPARAPARASSRSRAAASSCSAATRSIRRRAERPIARASSRRSRPPIAIWSRSGRRPKLPTCMRFPATTTGTTACARSSACSAGAGWLTRGRHGAKAW